MSYQAFISDPVAQFAMALIFGCAVLWILVEVIDHWPGSNGHG